MSGNRNDGLTGRYMGQFARIGRAHGAQPVQGQNTDDQYGDRSTQDRNRPEEEASISRFRSGCSFENTVSEFFVRSETTENQICCFTKVFHFVHRDSAPFSSFSRRLLALLSREETVPSAMFSISEISETLKP